MPIPQIINEPENVNTAVPDDTPHDKDCQRLTVAKTISRRTRSGTIIAAALSVNPKRARSGTIIAPTRARGGTITSRTRSGTIRAGGPQVTNNGDTRRTREEDQQGPQEQNHDHEWVDEEDDVSF